MRKLKKFLAYMLAVSFMLPQLPVMTVHADKTQIAIGGETVDIIYSTESQKDITMLYPMNIVNVNEGVSISEDKMKELLDGDIETVLPHMVMYENVDSKTTIDANQSSPVEYREAVTWLSSNNKLHLPETVNFKYSDLNVKAPASTKGTTPSELLYSWRAPDNGKLSNSKSFPFNKGKYTLSFSVGKNKYNLSADIDVTLNGKSILSQSNVYGETITVDFECEDTSTVAVSVRHEEFYDSETEQTHETPWDLNFYINPDVQFPTTKTSNNTEQVVEYNIAYDNVYANPGSKLNKSTYIMNLMKAVDDVRYSRPILINSAYTKKLNGSVSQHVTTEPLEQSLYHRYAKEAGLDFANSQMMMDYTHFGTRLMFTTPNVPELYITEALDRGIISPGQLNPNYESTRELFSEHAGIIPSYHPDAPPIRANYNPKYDPMGVVSGSLMASSRLETLYRLQLIPEHLEFDAKLQTIKYPNGSDGLKVGARGLLGANYTYTGRPSEFPKVDGLQKYMVDTDNISELVKTSGLGSLVNAITKQNFNVKQPFENTISSQLKEIKAKPPSQYAYFADENMTLMDAVRIAYDAIKVYSEPAITQLEINAVNSMFGVQLNNVKSEDKEILEYMFAKGILNPEESSILELYQPLTNELGLELIYRVSNPDARYTIKTDLSSTDQQLLDKGYSKTNATKSTTKTEVKKPEAITLDKDEIIYIRLEELFLKDVDGMAYYGGGDSGISNVDYQPSAYDISNNIFGLYSPEYHKSLNTFDPKHSPYYLGDLTLNYKSTVDGKNRKVTWLQYNLPPSFKIDESGMKGLSFNQTGNGIELPTQVTGLNNKSGFYFVPTQQKLDFIGVGADFDLRNPDKVVNIKGTGSLSFDKTTTPLATGHPQDKEDIYQLWKHLNPNSADRYEQGKYNPINGTQTPGDDGLDGVSDATPTNNGFKNPFVMDLYAAEPTTPTTTPPAQSGTEQSVTATNVFGFAKDGIKNVRFNNYLLFQVNSAGSITLNPEAEKALKEQEKIVAEIVRGADGTLDQVQVMFSSSDKSEINLTAFVESSIKTSIPTDGSKTPVGLMYFKFSDGNKTRMLIAESALSMFDIQVFYDSDHNTKVLQNTKTGVYGILSDQTNTCIIGNEFIHFPENAGMIEITDSGIYYNFDIVKKLFSYNNMAKIDLELDTTGLKIITNEEVTEITNAKLFYNGKNTGVSPLIYKSKTNSNYYLNVNSLGYGASYIMKSWQENDSKYTVMTEFVYEEIPDFTSKNRPPTTSSNPAPVVEHDEPMGKKPGDSGIPPGQDIMSARGRNANNNAQADGGGGNRNTAPVADGHTLTLANYGKYDEMLQQHYKSVFQDKSEAQTRLALSNLAVHWTLYSSAKLPPTIEENYISNPFVTPKFTVFKDGVEIVPTSEPELINKMYNEMDSVAGITKFGNDKFEGTTLTLADYLKDKDYFTKAFIQDDRDWAYDTVKECVLLNISQHEKIGEIKYLYDKGKNQLDMWASIHYVGYAKDEIPLWAKTSSFYLSDNYFYVGTTPVRANGPNILVDSKGVQYVFLGLATPPVQVDIPLDKLKHSMDADYVKSTFTNNELYSKFLAPYSEYPYTADMIKENKVSFLEGDPNVEQTKMFFINSISNKSTYFTKAGLTSSDVVLLRHADGTLKPHYYEKMTDESKRATISANPLTDAEVKALIKGGSATIRVQYNFPVGVTDLVYAKADKSKTLHFAGPKLYYTEPVEPVMDIATIIAKDIIASASSYTYKTNGNGTTSTFKLNGNNTSYAVPTYAKDLKQGDVILFDEYTSAEYNDIAVITQPFKDKSYVPVTTLFTAPDNKKFAGIEVLTEGRTNILLHQILSQKIYLRGGAELPLSKVTDLPSIQVATDSDFSTFMAFYSALGSPLPKPATGTADLQTNYKAVFSSTNQTILNLMKTTMGAALDISDLEFLVQVSDSANSTKLNYYSYKDGWKNPTGKALGEQDYDKSEYNYLARFDIYPYLEVEWVADYAVDPNASETRSVYRISGANLAYGQNVSAYSSYANYLKTDYQNVDHILGKKKLWDQFYLSADMLTADDLDAYVNSQFPELDKKKNEDKWTQFFASELFSKMLLTVEVILLLWGIVLLAIYGLCKFSLGRLFVLKWRLLKIFTFNQQQSPYNLNLKRCFLYTFLYLGIVTTVFYSGTWELLSTVTTSMINIFKDLYSYFDTITKTF